MSAIERDHTHDAAARALFRAIHGAVKAYTPPDQTRPVWLALSLTYVVGALAGSDAARDRWLTAEAVGELMREIDSLPFGHMLDRAAETVERYESDVDGRAERRSENLRYLADAAGRIIEGALALREAATAGDVAELRTAHDRTARHVTNAWRALMDLELTAVSA